MNHKKQIGLIVLFAFFVGLLFQCTSSNTFETRLGKMEIPQDNPMTNEKVKLGKKLFFDKQLSLTNTISCASCHIPEKAFTDGNKLSPGVHGRLSMRNTPTLLNVGYQHRLMFDGEIPSLEMQAVVPLKDTAEMANNMKTLIQKLEHNPEYQQAARRIFNRDFDAYVLTRSLAAFQRTIVSYETPFDKFQEGNADAISQSAKRGWKLFSEKLYCTKCHDAPFFTNFKNENNGLYADYTEIEDKGRYRINNDSTEIGSFKIPTLRNLERTAPYMHDGSMSSISEVIAHYEKGGNGHFNQSTIIQPFVLTNQERKDLITFLLSLSDPKN